MIKVTRAIHLFSAFWTLALAFLIFGDVMGRTFFTRPIPGTKEVLQNSVVAITFLQLPLAIYSGSMLRTSIFADAMPTFVRKVLRSVTALLDLSCSSALSGALGRPSGTPTGLANTKARVLCECRHGQCVARS